MGFVLRTGFLYGGADINMAFTRPIGFQQDDYYNYQ
jgi:hypothetical protein